VPVETKETVPPLQLQKSSPSPRRVFQAVSDITSVDTVELPELEKDFSPRSIRRKSKSPEKSRSVETIRSISPHPGSPPKPEADSGDLWSTAQPPLARHSSERKVLSPKKEPVEIPADFGSTVMEIQTSLRRDIERLRLDMLRQFVTFRNEIGDKSEGEVRRLRAENESLKAEVEKLKKEKNERNNERARWNLV